VYVSPGDVKRIADHTGRNDFYEFRAPGSSEYLHNEDDPAWQGGVFRPDGTRRVLRRRSDGDCTFLGPQGCTLPLEVRPLVCRLYPYDYTEQGIRPELARGCPTELLRAGQGLIEALGMNLGDAQRWHRQLYAEIRLEPHLAAAAPGVAPAVTATAASSLAGAEVAVAAALPVVREVAVAVAAEIGATLLPAAGAIAGPAAASLAAGAEIAATTEVATASCLPAAVPQAAEALLAAPHAAPQTASPMENPQP
jgi:Fe-S-cluster containining protein